MGRDGGHKMLGLTYSNEFKKERKLMKKRGYDMSLMTEVIEMLKSGKPPGKEYDDHPLRGEFQGSRECHIRPDWLLIYWKGEKHIELQRTGTHSDLF